MLTDLCANGMHKQCVRRKTDPDWCGCPCHMISVEHPEQDRRYVVLLRTWAQRRIAREGQHRVNVMRQAHEEVARIRHEVHNQLETVRQADIRAQRAEESAQRIANERENIRRELVAARESRQDVCRRLEEAVAQINQLREQVPPKIETRGQPRHVRHITIDDDAEYGGQQ